MAQDFLEIVKDLQDRIKILEGSTGIRNLTIPANGKIILPHYSADPAGGSSTNGQLYYNTTTNKCRKRENGAWADM